MIRSVSNVARREQRRAKMRRDAAYTFSVVIGDAAIHGCLARRSPGGDWTVRGPERRTPRGWVACVDFGAEACVEIGHLLERRFDADRAGDAA